MQRAVCKPFVCVRELTQHAIADAIATRSAQVTQLHRTYLVLRAGMVAMRAQMAGSSAYIDKLATIEGSIDAKIASGLSTLFTHSGSW